MWKTRIVSAAVGITCFVACSSESGTHVFRTTEAVRYAKYKALQPLATKDSTGATELGRQAKATPACNTESDTSLDPQAIVQRQTIKLKREFRRTIRTNCEGKVLSDKLETITSPWKPLKLNAKTWTRLGHVVGTVHNRTTCGEGGMNLEKLWDVLLKPFSFLTREYFRDLKATMGFPDIEFYVDTSPSVAHMRVLKGRENFIDYEFRKCEESRYNSSSKTYECLKTSPVEKGTLILTVEYEELTLPDIREIRECSDKL